MSFLAMTMSPPEDVAMDDKASLPCDVSSGGDWLAGPTPCFGADVVDQQQLRPSALQWHQCSQPSAAFSWLAVPSHHNPWLLLAVTSFGGVSSFSGLLVVLIGVIIDFGLIGNGRGAVRR